MARSAVPRAAALVVAIAILPWIAASQVGDRPAPPMSSEPTSAWIGSLATPLVVTPDRPKVWPNSKRTDESPLLTAVPPTRAGLDASRSVVGILRLAAADVLAVHLAERGPPLLAT